MNKTFFSCILAAFIGFCSTALGQSSELIEIYIYENEKSSVRIYPDVQNGTSGISAEFVGTEDLHYYATEKAASAVAPGLNLQINAQAEGINFGKPVFPEPALFRDPAVEKDIEVFAGNFKIFIPALSGLNRNTNSLLELKLSGIACTSKVCLMPFDRSITALLAPDPSGKENLPKIEITSAGKDQRPWRFGPEPDKTDKPTSAEDSQSLRQLLSDWNETEAGRDWSAFSAPVYFLLAVLAGISINIMPCVLPILPLIIMRLISQAKESGPRRIALGFSFCGGIVLFFAVFALISVIITLATGTVIDLNSLYRQPAAVIVLFLIIVFFALVFLDVLTLTLPTSVSNTQQRIGGGFAGSAGMGFFAGLLSTPCSGALLGAVLVWAQSKPIHISSIAIILMGVGMAMPYILLVSIPKLLDFLPKPGPWMDIFKKAGGFLLLIIAVKFTLTPLGKDRLIDVSIYGIIFAFCIWMWGKWVTYNTPAAKKWTVRLVAVVLAVLAGFWLLPAPSQSMIDWREYDAAMIQNALEKNQPVLIKFTADWCGNCKVVEKNVYQRPDIAELINGMDLLPVIADTTQAVFPASKDFKPVFGEPGSIPLTILLNPQNEKMTKLRGIFDFSLLKQALLNLPEGTSI